MTSAFRKLNLTTHVTSSVGWLGAVVGFLALSIAGVLSRDTEVVRSVYVAMNLIGQFVIVPLSFAAVLTGLVLALGTHWGLFRHYWVAVKFVLTTGATALLLLHQFTAVAGAAKRVSATAAGAWPDVAGLGPQLVGDAGLAVLTLLVTTTLSVYKPWGLTAYGHRQQQWKEGSDTVDRSLSVGGKILFAIIGLILTGIIALHLAGRGLHHGR